jgi:hypothetical protein
MAVKLKKIIFGGGNLTSGNKRQEYEGKNKQNGITFA